MLENSADRQDRFIIYRRRVFDTAFRRTCMNYGIIADIDGNTHCIISYEYLVLFLQLVKMS